MEIWYGSRQFFRLIRRSGHLTNLLDRQRAKCRHKIEINKSFLNILPVFRWGWGILLALYVPSRPHIDCPRTHSPIQVIASAGMRCGCASVFDTDAKRYLQKHTHTKEHRIEWIGWLEWIVAAHAVHTKNRLRKMPSAILLFEASPEKTKWFNFSETTTWKLLEFGRTDE